MAEKRYMQVVETPHPEAAILRWDNGTLPVIRGDGDLNLACGNCKVVLCRNVTIEDLVARFGSKHQLLIVCPNCEVFNLLPSQRG